MNQSAFLPTSLPIAVALTATPQAIDLSPTNATTADEVLVSVPAASSDDVVVLFHDPNNSANYVRGAHVLKGQSRVFRKLRGRTIQAYAVTSTATVYLSAGEAA